MSDLHSWDELSYSEEDTPKDPPKTDRAYTNNVSLLSLKKDSYYRKLYRVV